LQPHMTLSQNRSRPIFKLEQARDVCAGNESVAGETERGASPVRSGDQNAQISASVTSHNPIPHFCAAFRFRNSPQMRCARAPRRRPRQSNRALKRARHGASGCICVCSKVLHHFTSAFAAATRDALRPISRFARHGPQRVRCPVDFRALDYRQLCSRAGFSTA
jgi:hypothetical protein